MHACRSTLEDPTSVSHGGGAQLLNSGSLVLGGTGTSLGGNWTNDEVSTVSFQGQANDAAVTIPVTSSGSRALQYTNLGINNPGTTFSLAPANSAADVNGRLTLTGGTLGITGTQVLHLSGSLIERGTAATAGSGTLRFDNQAPVTLSGSSVGTNLVIAGNTVTLSHALDAYRNLSLTGGTLDVSASNYAITLSGSWLKMPAASFTARSGTVTLDGRNQTLSGSTTFYNLTKSGSLAATLTFAAGTTQTIGHALSLHGAASQVLSLRSSQTGSQWRIDPQGTRDISYVDVEDSNNVNASVLICTNSCSNSFNNTNWTFPWAGTVYNDEGATTVGAGRTVAVSVNGGAPATATTDSNGTFLVVNPAVNGDVVAIYLKGNTEKAALVTRTDGGNFGGFNLYQNTLILRAETGSLTNAHLATADDAGDSDLTGFYTVTGNDVTVATGRQLLVWPGKTYAPGGNVAADDVDVDGTLAMSSNALNVSGSFDATGGSFTTTGTVTFDAASPKTITSNGKRFQNLTFNNPAGRWTPTDSLAVSGALTITSGTLNMSGHTLSNRGGTFSNAGKLRLNGNETLAGFTNDTHQGVTEFAGASSYTGLAGQTAFYHLGFSGAGTWTLNSAFSASGTVLLTGGTLDVSASNYGITTRKGWIDRGAGAFVPRRGTVTFAGSGLVASNDAFSGVLLNQRHAVLALASNLALRGNMTLSGGTLSESGSVYSITLSGSWLRRPAGSYQQGSGSVILNGGNQALSGSTTFFNLSKTAAAASTLTFAAGTTQTVRHTWTAQGAPSNLLSMRSSRTGTQWKIDPQATHSLSFVDVQDSNNVNAASILCADDCTNSNNNTNWFFPIQITAYADSGATLLGSGKTIALSLNSGAPFTTRTNAASVAAFTGVVITPGDVVTMWIDGEPQQGTTVTVSNGTSLSFGIYMDYLTVEHEYGTGITNANLRTASTVNDSDVDAIYTMSGSTQLVMKAGKTLRVKCGSTYAPGGKVTVNDIEICGTFSMGTNDVLVKGSWDATGGTFTANNTVTFSSGGQETITSNGNSFKNVTFALEGQNAHWITTDTMNVSGNMVVHNADGSTDTTPPVLSAVDTPVLGESGAVVTWTTDESANSKVIYGTSTGSMTLSGSLATFDLSHAIILTHLSPSTTYFYTVVSRDLAGNTATGSVESFTTREPSNPPDYTPPVLLDVQATVLGETGSLVTWVTDEAATSKIVYGTASGLYLRTASHATLDVSHAILLPNLTGNTVYYYRVVSSDRSGNTATGTQLSFETGTGSVPDTTAPVISAVQHRFVSDSGALISWITNEYATATVVYGTASGTYFSSLTNANRNLDHAMTLSGLTANTVYYYRVVSTDRSGNTATGAQRTFQTHVGFVPDTTPPAITDVRSRFVSDSGALITWLTDEYADSIVGLGTASGNYTLSASNPNLGVDHAMTLSGLTANTVYYYRVVSKDASGNVGTGTQLTFQTSLGFTPDTTPPVISGVQARFVTDSGALIAWVTDEYADSRVQVGTASGTYSLSVATSHRNVDHALTLSGLTAQTLYYYRVVSQDSSGNTATGAQLTFTTAAGSQAASSAGGGASAPAPFTTTGGGGGRGSRADTTPPTILDLQVKRS